MLCVLRGFSLRLRKKSSRSSLGLIGQKLRPTVLNWAAGGSPKDWYLLDYPVYLDSFNVAWDFLVCAMIHLWVCTSFICVFDVCVHVEAYGHFMVFFGFVKKLKRELIGGWGVRGEFFIYGFLDLFFRDRSFEDCSFSVKSKDWGTY
jgi:hypothetical protein